MFKLVIHFCFWFGNKHKDLVGAVRDPKGMWRMLQKKFKIGAAGILAHAAVAGVKKISYKSLLSQNWVSVFDVEKELTPKR